MCLAVPGLVLSLDSEQDPLSRTGNVQFGAIVKQIHMACVPDVQVGQYVLVHVGLAIAVLDEKEAQRNLEILETLEEELL